MIRQLFINEPQIIELTKSEIEGYNDTESGGADLCLHRRVINPD